MGKLLMSLKDNYKNVIIRTSHERNFQNLQFTT